MKRQHEKAVAEAERAIALDPNGADSHVALGYALSIAGRPEQAIAHYGLTATYSLTGHDAEARAQAKEVLRVQPKFSVERYAKRLPYKDGSEIERLMQALRKAGPK